MDMADSFVGECMVQTALSLSYPIWSKVLREMIAVAYCIHQKMVDVVPAGPKESKGVKEWEMHG